MSWSLAVAHRSYRAVTVFCHRPLLRHSIQHRRLHASPPVPLAHSDSSDIANLFKLRSPGGKLRMIQTLDPSRLRSSDFFDVSLRQMMQIWSSTNPPLPFRTHYICDRNRYPRFPKGTHGFLYYQPPNPGAPPAAGHLRFRVTPGNDPASFIQGSDLRLPDGLPWGISLLSIVGKSENAKSMKMWTIRQLLIDDGLVTPGLLQTCIAILNPHKNLPHTHIIHSFGQLLHVDFGRRFFDCFMLSTNQLRRHRSIGIFAESRPAGSCIRPYLGSALCCFERSNLPQHIGTRTAVVRIVKILSPPKSVYPNYDGCVPLPVEGEFVHFGYKQVGLQPRSFNVDSPLYTNLQPLFRDES
ncbi:hypothetical protein PILCRDRAFT_815309 [Piloderma croceum F 1598]|uniref:Uncharacterized protein n=1 Tax=Piloderma croceum (strain F 1598) TaxID=765440 RepID=A0A0C3FS50_PILCF|nr:hypothetical protein PILCRDRAFT_815309 [Piloderma croceum F 1598]